jgi:glycine cleavage system aminomethyltransferase T
MIARTGYTGEDGFEIYIPSDEPTSGRVWGEVLEAGAEFGILPCGLGARNTLRLEAAMALYGHEISETINVFEADWGATPSSTRAISWGARRWWRSKPQAGRSASWWAWR